jgi:hypothetical protein
MPDLRLGPASVWRRGERAQEDKDINSNIMSPPSNTNYTKERLSTQLLHIHKNKEVIRYLTTDYRIELV